MNPSDAKTWKIQRPPTARKVGPSRQKIPICSKSEVIVNADADTTIGGPPIQDIQIAHPH